MEDKLDLIQQVLRHIRQDISSELPHNGPLCVYSKHKQPHPHNSYTCQAQNLHRHAGLSSSAGRALGLESRVSRVESHLRQHLKLFQISCVHLPLRSSCVSCDYTLEPIPITQSE